MSESHTPEQIKAAQAERAAAFAAQGLTEESFFFRPRPATFDAATNQPIVLEGEEFTPAEKDAEGKEIKAATVKRLPIKLGLPYATNDSLIALLQDDATSAATLAYLVELSNDAIFAAAQVQVSALIKDSKLPVQEAIDIEALKLYSLATAPKAVSTRGIPKEVWAAFKVDFIEVMTTNFGVSLDGATKASKLIADDRFQSVKTAVKLLETLHTYLNNWFTKTSPESQEKFLPVLEESLKKIETYTQQGEQNILESIA